MARSTEIEMDALHGALCGYFLRLIRGEIPELVKETTSEQDEDGVTVSSSKWVETGLMVRPGAGDLAVMAKFLKDNAITGAIAEGGDLSELEKQLAARHARRGKLPTAADVKAALKDMGGDLLQ